ncbi:hypothetical protein KEM48_014261 [Puccinia striiformis f. sp. tritici PST-130]|nr:hypothetical protein KEM48_014261 [Puccinia striiformis f. sp. tritici PST-130]
MLPKAKHDLLRPPAILITDHPSELIPPSPPQLEFHSEGSSSPTSPQHEYPMPHSYQNHHDNQSVAEASEPRQRDTAAIGTELNGNQLPGCVPRPLGKSGASKILGSTPSPVSLVIDHEPFDFAPKRTSLNTLNSSQTIRELAAVTEDLRALIDSEMDADCSWSHPSHDVHFEPSSSTKSKRFSTGSRVKKSASESSIETVVSADSNASILEIASLHTAQTRSVRGVSAESSFVKALLKSKLWIPIIE